MIQTITKFAILITLIITGIFQNLLAGVIYTNLDPDKIVSPPDGGAQSYSIDLNADGNDDFNLQINNLSDGYQSVKISGILKANQVAGEGDTTNIEEFYLLSFSLNESIDNESPYLWYNNWDSQWEHDLPMTICGYGINKPGNWAGGLMNRYLGVRFLFQDNYHYGWIDIEVPTLPNACTIKGFAYESAPNTGIKAGQTTDGVIENKEINSNLINIIPNPAYDRISISFSRKSTAM